MRRRVLVLAVMAVSSFAAVASTVRPVGALSCAAHPDGSPAAIASGTERLSSEDKFFDHFDFAVVGTVTEIRTVGEGEANYGATTIHLDVVAVLGDEPAPQAIRIASPDPGWMSGYPYEAGVTYFIPVQAEGPQGEANYSFLCDPITEVDAGVAIDLAQLASNAGIPFSTPDDALAPVPDSDDPVAAAAVKDSSPPVNSTDGTRVGPIALTLAVLAGVVATMVHLARRRSITAPT